MWEDVEDEEDEEDEGDEEDDVDDILSDGVEYAWDYWDEFSKMTGRERVMIMISWMSPHIFRRGIIHYRKQGRRTTILLVRGRKRLERNPVMKMA